MKALTKSNFLSRMALVATVCCALPTFAGTWYVDAARPDDTGDGLSPTTAKKYIQSAVTLAEASTDADRVVKVAPGTYDDGVTLDVHGYRNRVVITKKLTLESTDGRDKTFIVGVRDATATGMGPNSVRGVFLSGEAVNGTVIRGFTFKNCSAPAGTETGKNSGGAVGFGRDDTTVYVKDCSAIDCVAQYGGAFSRVTAIRCLALRCNNGNVGNAGSALYSCKAYCCVFDSCGSTTSYSEQTLRGDGPYVNCTAVGNSGSLLRTSANQRMYNFLSCLANRQECDTTNNGGDYIICGNNSGISSLAHCKKITDAAGLCGLLLSPLTGDYRLVAGGGAVNYADPAYCRLDWIPEVDRGLDFYGTQFDVSGAAGTIHCGAVQTAVAVAGGSTALARTMPTTGGSSVVANIHAQTNAWPGQAWIPTDDSVFAVGFGTAAPTRFPTAAGGFWLTIPESVSTVGSPIRATAKLIVGAGQAYTSIQAAIDAASDAADAYTIIAVEPGTYGPISISGKNVFIRSTQGKAVTIIQGVKDTDDPATVGCGPKAVRCVTVDSSAGRLVAVEGLTLRGGGTAIGEAGTGLEVSGSATVGGGFAAKTVASDKSDAQLIGCDIVDCSGFDAAAIWGGWIQCCTITGSSQPTISGADSVVRQAILSSCVLYENDFYGNQILANGAQANNCTIVARHRGEVRDLASVTSFLQGVIVCGGRNSKATPTVGSVLFGLQGAITVTSGYTTDDPQMLNVGMGDFTLLEGSSAIGLWDPREKVAGNPWKYMVGDYEGNPMMVTDGKVTAGAFQTFYQPKDVYVDAARPNDDGDGLTAETAKRTLAGAMAVAYSGDTIHVAAGTYDEGTMPQRVAVGSGDAFTVAARVIVPARATLVGAGSDRTIIRGGYVEGEAGELVRCVILGAGATLKSVTVERGQVRSDGPATDDKNAAGILGDRTSVVEDCVIANNHSYRYGAVYGGTFRRCVIRNNWIASTGEASAGSFLTAENCLFSANRGKNLVCDYERIVNCTFLSDNSSIDDGKRLGLFGDSAAGAAIYNSALILAPTQASSLPDLYNCLVPKIVGTTRKWQIASATDCLLEETTVDASWNGVPTKDFVGLDRGLTTAVPVGMDLAGVQRVQNVAVDIGCYEFNWLPTYTTDFDRHGWVTVTSTTGVVTDQDGKLVLAEGAVLKAEVTQATKPVRLVAGAITGELVVKVNGTNVATLSPAESSVNLDAFAAGDQIEIVVATGSASGLVLKSAAGCCIIFR